MLLKLSGLGLLQISDEVNMPGGILTRSSAGELGFEQQLLTVRQRLGKINASDLCGLLIIFGRLQL